MNTETAAADRRWPGRERASSIAVARVWEGPAAEAVDRAVALGSAPAALGVSDPREWTPVEWAGDLLPRLAHGTAAAAVPHRVCRPGGRGG